MGDKVTECRINTTKNTLLRWTYEGDFPKRGSLACS
jgi:hypothetical protein